MKKNKLFNYIIILFFISLQWGCSKPIEKESHQVSSASEKTNEELVNFLTQKVETYEFLELDPIYVNLPANNGKGGEQFISVTIIVQLKDSKLKGEFEANKFLIRDRITKTMSLRIPLELAKVSNREVVANEVTLTLNAIFEPELTQAFITYNKNSINDEDNILRLQSAEVLPTDLSATSNLSPEIIEMIRKMKISDLPIKGISFKEFRMNLNS